MSGILDFRRATADIAPRPAASGSGATFASFGKTAVEAIALLGVYLLLQRFVTRVCYLPESGPAAASMLGECLRARPAALLPALAAVLLMVAAVPRFREGWRQFEHGGALRWFVTAAVMALAWTGTAYAYNGWYDRWHLPDRTILLCLAALVPWRPAFVLPFVLVFWTIVRQLETPPLGFQILSAEFRPVANLLTMFSAAFLVQIASRRRTMTGFLFFALCIVAANFWVPGLAKLRIGWFEHGHVYLLLPNAYTHGWLGFLDAGTIARISSALASADLPMRTGTLAIECGALLLFASPRIARALLVAFTLLLAAFFLTLGYLFWKWLVVQAALFVLVFGRSPHAADWRRELFSPQYLVLSVAVIGGAQNWFAPAALAWFDTPLANALRYEGVGESGAVYDLPSGFFAPYESHIAMGSFAGRLTRTPLLTASYGVTSSKAMANTLLATPTPGGILELEAAATGSSVLRDEDFERQFDEFVRRIVRASNEADRADAFLPHLASRLRPPPFLWTFAHATLYDRQEPLAAVRVYWVSSFFDGTKYQLFRTTLLRTVRMRP